MDWLPTLLAAAGDPDIKQKLLDGWMPAKARTYKVHLDGYNSLPYLTGQEEKRPREEIFYFSDDGDLMALRYRRLEGVLHGAARERHAAYLGEPVYGTAGAEALAPSPGSL